MAQHSSYLEKVFSTKTSFNETVDLAVKRLRAFRRRKDGKFDAIFCRGVSGITIASAVSYRLKCGLIVVRKDDEKSHANYQVEGISHDYSRILFLDDFTCTGDTLVKCLEKIEESSNANDYKIPSLVGSYFYARDGLESNKTMLDFIYAGNREMVSHYFA